MTSAALDFETQASYEVEVTATDEVGRNRHDHGDDHRGPT